MKNIKMAFGIFLSAGVLSGCGSVANEKMSYCYELVDEPGTMIIITPQGEEITDMDGSSIFFDTVLVSDPGGEQKTAGEIRENSFYYGDGSRWDFSDVEARGFGGLIEGMVAAKKECL